MNHTQGHKANDVFAPRGAWQSGVSADFFALGYDAFGSLLPGRNYSSNSYRFGFNGMEKDDEMHGATGTSYAFEYRIHDTRLGRFLSVDPLSSSYPWNSPYAFAENRVIDGIDLEGAEYLSANEARVKVVGGQVHLNIANLHTITQNLWKQRDAQGPWPPNSIGYPTELGQLTWPSLPANARTARLSPSSSNAQTWQPKVAVEVPLTKQSNYTQPDRRFKDRSMSTPVGPGLRGGAGAALAVNAINWSFEQVRLFAVVDDQSKMRQHVSLLQTQVLADLQVALDKGMVPEQYRNMESMNNIANVVLSGVNPTNDSGIFDVGIDIVKNISKNWRGAPTQQVINGNPAGSTTPSDNTSTRTEVPSPTF